MAEWIIGVRMIGEVGVDSGDGLTFGFRGLSGQSTDPVPRVYVDGVLQASGYTYNAGGPTTSVSVTFVADKTGKSISLDYRWLWELDMESEVSGYTIQQACNVRDGEDVNGAGFITESYRKVGPWKGVLAWQYITIENWELIHWIASQPGSRIDIGRASMIAPLTLISNLYIKSIPPFVEIPGVPDRCHATMEVVELQ